MIGTSDPTWIAEELFLDSLLFLHVVPDTVESLVDIGSGAGLPGIPIKIVKPSLRMLLVESRQRRASFLSAIVRELGLTGIQVLSERVLTVPANWRGAFDGAVARCAGSSESTMRLGAEFVRRGGTVVLSGPPAPRKAEIGRRIVVRVGADSPRSPRSFLVQEV